VAFQSLGNATVGNLCKLLDAGASEKYNECADHSFQAFQEGKMKKNLFVVLSLVVALACTSMAPVFAGAYCRCPSPSARGDYQILSNDASGAVIRAWISNNCRTNRFVYVTVVANATDGSKVQGAYALFLPCLGGRPVDIDIDSEISTVDKIIVTSLTTTYFQP
jgi:hypothetical protein